MDFAFAQINLTETAANLQSLLPDRFASGVSLLRPQCLNLCALGVPKSFFIY